MSTAANRTPNPVDDTGLEIQCQDCKFYRGTPISGVCRGSPPVPVLVGITQGIQGNQPQLMSYFPSVDALAWCGKFDRDPDKELDPLPIQAPAGAKEGNA